MTNLSIHKVNFFFVCILLAILTVFAIYPTKEEPTVIEEAPVWCLVTEYDSLEELDEHNEYATVFIKKNGGKFQLHVKCD